jgi:Domain of unknown function (DUF4192)
MEMRTPTDVLALIPTAMQRKPEEILILICIKDNGLQAILGMQHCTDIGDAGNYAQAIIEQMVQMKPDALVMVFYTEEESDCSHEPFEHVAIVLKVAVETLTPMECHDPILVKGGRYHIYGTDQWHDLDEVKQSAMAADLVLHGFQLEPTGPVIPDPTAVTDDLTARIDDAVSSIPEFPKYMTDTWATPYVVELRQLYDQLLNRGFGATEDEAVQVIAAFQSPALRDRLMVDTISHTDNVMQFGETITGLSDAPLDHSRLVTGLALMDNLMQYTADRHRLPVLVTCAWFHWMLGRTLDAVTYCEEALKVDPDYKLAQAFERYITDLMRIPVHVLHSDGEE